MWSWETEVLKDNSYLFCNLHNCLPYPYFDAVVVVVNNMAQFAFHLPDI